MYVDDLLLSIRSHLLWPERFDDLLNEWDRSFLASVGDQVAVGKALSTNQAAIVLKLIRRLRHPLIRHGMASDDDLDRMVQCPEYRHPPYPSLNIPREVRYLGDNVLAFRFKSNDMLVASIREFGTVATVGLFASNVTLLPRPSFNWEHRIWLVPVNRHNLAAIIAFIHEYRFSADAAVFTYLRVARASRDRKSSFAVTEGVIVANVCDHPLLAAWVTEVSDGTVL